MNHVAWSCDGKKLAAVGVDKLTRVWSPEKNVRVFSDNLTGIPNLILSRLDKPDIRSAQTYSGGHADDVDYVSWNPTHPDLFCTSSQKDRRIVFWDARRASLFLTLTCFLVSSNLFIQKVNTSNSVLCGYLQSRLFMHQTVNHYCTYQ